MNESPFHNQLSGPSADEKPKSRKRKPKPGPPPAVWISIATAAALLDFSPGAMRKKIQRRDIPEELLRHVGHSIRLRRDKLLEWMDQPEVQG